MVVKIVDYDKANASRSIWDNKWTQKPDGQWEELFVFDIRPLGFRPDSLPTVCPNTRPGVTVPVVHKFGQLIIDGELPEPGTIIQMTTWKGLSGLQGGDKYRITIPKSAIANANVGKENLQNITVFPNPYFGAQGLETNKYQRFMRFTGLPLEANIKIFSLSGVFITELSKDPTSQYLDWNLQNSDGLPVASGMYIAYIEMPGIGTKILKLAVIQETQYLDRI